MNELTNDTDMEALSRLSKDLRQAAVSMTPDEARFLVDAYYQMQDNRIRSNNQVRSMTNEPHKVLTWFAENNEMLEGQVKAALMAYAKSKTVGKWSLSITGIGPVITAGLLAHIDIEKCCNAGHLFSFAGLSPVARWEKGQKRPWNASLKTLAWKIGQSFMKFSGHEKCVFGHLYLERKSKEWECNLRGEYKDKAAEAIKIRKFRDETGAVKWYQGKFSPVDVREWMAKDERPLLPPLANNGDGVPMLPPAHIDARARRWSVKLFLSRFWEELYKDKYHKDPPEPYAIAILGHSHKLDLP